MEQKQLKKLSRVELLELMLEQSRMIDSLREEIAAAKEQLRERNLRVGACGSIAEAAAEVSSLYSSARTAADLYLDNILRVCSEQAESAGQAEAWEEKLKELRQESREEKVQELYQESREEKVQELHQESREEKLVELPQDSGKTPDGKAS